MLPRPASDRQAVFALVYRTQDVFGGGGGGGRAESVSHTCDDVMQVACDALDKEQHPEVRPWGGCVFPLDCPVHGVREGIAQVMMMVAGVSSEMRPKVAR